MRAVLVVAVLAALSACASVQASWYRCDQGGFSFPDWRTECERLGQSRAAWEW